MDEAGLPEARDRLLGRLVDLFSRDPDVMGVFLGGSMASESADAWSDIDLRVLVAHSEHPSFVRRRKEIPTAIPGFLFNEWLHGAIHCISHFSDFVKADIFYLDESNFAPSPWYGLPIRILHDPLGTIAEVVAKSRGLTFELDPDEIDRSVSKGTAAVHEAYRRLRRGELIFVQSLLDELRQHMTFADDWLHHRVPQAVPFSHLEGRASNALLRAFHQSFTELDGRRLAAVLRTLALAYKDQLEKLVPLTRRDLSGQARALALMIEEL
jgi:predicted nucleotidyltransferase